MKTLPNESKMRYHYPISSGALAYFPAAIAGVAKHSYIGGAKYNDGSLVHLRYVSTQHMDCVQRHLMDLQDLLAAKERGETEVNTLVYAFDLKKDMPVQLPIDQAILIECNALSWRSLAISQEMHEKLGGKPLAPAARLKPLDPPAVKVLSYTEGRIVAVIKAIREVAWYTLKDAHDLARSTYPIMVPITAKYTYEQARQLFIAAGATVE